MKPKPIAKIAAAMPGTRFEIAEKTGLSAKIVSRWLVFMVDANSCHVGGWERSENNGPFKRIYHAGPGVAVPCTIERWSRRPAKKPAGKINITRRDPLMALFGRA
jgi:hypothetical protein